MSLELWDWRRRVGDLYAEARREGAGRDGWERWRVGREDLFASHPQSPLAAGRSLAWFEHDPAWRVEGTFVDDWRGEAWRTDEGTFERIGTVRFEVPAVAGVVGEAASLAVWWLDAYAGGLFVPFRDATAGVTTYGGGRYLLDTAKGADLGHEGDRLVLDFNYAYHPSCAHDPRWPCPLAPPANRLPFAVEAGERLSVSP